MLPRRRMAQRASLLLRRIVLISLVLSLGGIWLVGSLRRPSHHSILQPGARFPRRSIKSIRDETITWGRNWTLILYSEPLSKHGLKVGRFCATLLDHFRERLTVVSIVPGKISQAQIYATHVVATWPVIADDGQWADELGIRGADSAFFFVDPSGIVRFSSDSAAEPEDVRELAERFLLDEITYADLGTTAQVVIGSHFPSIEVKDLRSWQTRQWPSPQTKLAVVFAARCVECSLPIEVAVFRAYEKAHPANDLPDLVFSSQFPPAVLLDAIQGSGLRAPLLQAVAAIPGIEDAWSLDFHTPSEVMVLSLENSKIRRFETWQSFAKRQPAAGR
jgi:hypothetical protein